jgi:oligopeptide transport system ATP-binding protein
MAELLRTVELEKSFPVRRGFFGQQRARLLAVDRVNLTIDHGETLGLVGESGCGKSTLGLTLMRLYEPTGGQILLDGQDLTALRGEALRQVRPQLQMIFQDPFASVDPRLTVEQIIREPLDIGRVGTPAQRREQVRELAEVVRLPRGALGRYPGEFSGGQQQRIGIARALALRPKLLICDEPVSSLDVSVQAQILNLLRDLQDQYRLSYLFISHNIAITAFMSHRIGVMYLGQLVEIGPSKAIVAAPRHPYTQALLRAVPNPDPEHPRERRKLTGDVPSPVERPAGCPFHPRCPLAQAVCTTTAPVRLRRGRGETRRGDGPLYLGQDAGAAGGAARRLGDHLLPDALDPRWPVRRDRRRPGGTDPGGGEAATPAPLRSGQAALGAISPLLAERGAPRFRLLVHQQRAHRHADHRGPVAVLDPARPADPRLLDRRRDDPGDYRGGAAAQLDRPPGDGGLDLLHGDAELCPGGAAPVHLRREVAVGADRRLG